MQERRNMIIRLDLDKIELSELTKTLRRMNVHVTCKNHEALSQKLALQKRKTWKREKSKYMQ